jgi:hypothetical protein
MVERRSVAPVVGGSSPLAHPKFYGGHRLVWLRPLTVNQVTEGSNPSDHPKFERDVMDMTEVAQMKAEIMKLRKLADELAPGALKQALSKRATELGKKISPYVNRASA